MATRRPDEASAHGRGANEEARRVSDSYDAVGNRGAQAKIPMLFPSTSSLPSSEKKNDTHSAYDAMHQVTYRRELTLFTHWCNASRRWTSLTNPT
jgi:hypothetical protein